MCQMLGGGLKILCKASSCLKLRGIMCSPSMVHPLAPFFHHGVYGIVCSAFSAATETGQGGSGRQIVRDIIVLRSTACSCRGQRTCFDDTCSAA